jgi:hypothetical protein
MKTWVQESEFSTISDVLTSTSSRCIDLCIVYNQTHIEVVKLFVKDVGSILFLKNGLKKICRKNYLNYLRINTYAVAHCFPNILDAIVFENMNLFEDKIGRPPTLI